MGHSLKTTHNTLNGPADVALRRTNVRNVGFRWGNESANLCQTDPPRSHRVIGAGDSPRRAALRAAVC